MNLRLSIITPFYNREDHLEKTIKSVLENCQDREDVELILVNDGSTDNSKSIALGYSKRYKYIDLISYDDNRGVNYARNKGIVRAKGEFVTFLDSDDCLRKGSLNILFDTIERHSSLHFLFLISGNQRAPHKNSIFYKDWIRGKLPADFLHVVKSEILKENLFFEDYTAYEELNWYRVIKKTEPVRLEKKVLVDINRSRNDRLSGKLELEEIGQLSEKLKANITFIKNYGRDVLRYAPRRYCRRVLRIVITWAKLNYLKSNTEGKKINALMRKFVCFPVVYFTRYWKQEK